MFVETTVTCIAKHERKYEYASTKYLVIKGPNRARSALGLVISQRKHFQKIVEIQILSENNETACVVGENVRCLQSCV